MLHTHPEPCHLKHVFTSLCDFIHSLLSLWCHEGAKVALTSASLGPGRVSLRRCHLNQRVAAVSNQPTCVLIVPNDVPSLLSVVNACAWLEGRWPRLESRATHTSTLSPVSAIVPVPGRVGADCSIMRVRGGAEQQFQFSTLSTKSKNRWISAKKSI